MRAGLHIDRVWSGHPVGFALLTDGQGHQFAAYYDAERRVTVAARSLLDDTWTYTRPAGIGRGRGRFSNVTGWDSHNYLALAQDRDGCLHLAGNMHNDPLVYYRATRPHDATSLVRLDRMTGRREDHVTYPVFFKDAAGDLLFRYRDGESGNGGDLYNVYDASAHAWSPLLESPLLDGEGRRSAYALDPVLGPDGCFHLAWMWRDTPDAATNHTLSYARSRDFKHWEDSRGQPRALPITLATGDVIDPAGPGGGLINMTFNLGFDAHARPVVVYHRYDAAGRSQVFAARPDPAAGNGWQVRQTSGWDFRWAFGGGGSLTAEVVLGAPKVIGDGTLLVDYVTERAGAGRWRLREDSLARLPSPPAPPMPLPEELLRPTRPGMTVQTAVSHHAGRRWVLRWETLPRHFDRAREQVPAPSDLTLHKMPDDDYNDAARAGA